MKQILPSLWGETEVQRKTWGARKRKPGKQGGFLLNSRDPKPHKPNAELRAELQHGFNHMQLAQLKEFFQGPVRSCQHFKWEQTCFASRCCHFCSGAGVWGHVLGKVACSGREERQGKGSLSRRNALKKAHMLPDRAVPGIRECDQLKLTPKK